MGASLADGASASGGASDSAVLLPRCEDELRHSRLHFQAFPAPAPPGRPTNARIHWPPIDAHSRRRAVAGYFNGRRERREKWEGKLMLITFSPIQISLNKK
jgi:hypothetical protein